MVNVKVAVPVNVERGICIGVALFAVRVKSVAGGIGVGVGSINKGVAPAGAPRGAIATMNTMTRIAIKDV